MTAREENQQGAKSLKPRSGPFTKSWERTHQFIHSANTYRAPT